MRTRITKLTIAESRPHLRRLAHLRDIGVAVGSDQHFVQQAQQQQRLRLQQVDEALAGFYPLPVEGFIFVTKATLITPVSTFIVTDCEASVSWDELPLDLEEPPSFPLYKDVVAAFYPQPCTILNSWLTGQHPLHRARKDGLIIARGPRSIPAEYGDHSLLDFHLTLWDENDDELPFILRGRVDRSLQVKYERRMREQCRPRAPREPIFKRKPYTGPENPPAQRSASPWRLPDERQTTGDISYNDIKAPLSGPPWPPTEQQRVNPDMSADEASAISNAHSTLLDLVVKSFVARLEADKITDPTASGNGLGSRTGQAAFLL